ncbi:MAG TPA: allophanate hydrolase [Burkholderiaceae bacterium]|nr:allophanate hydrolase [Burkholderiaceae bacterium]
MNANDLHDPLLRRRASEWTPATGSLDIACLTALYARGELTPAQVVDTIYDRIEAAPPTLAWIHLLPRQAALQRAREVMQWPAGVARHPLWGIPFSVKDCNDVPGMPTTNAFAPTAYMAQTTGQAIQRLLDAGAICLGKVNMDQFGIGLVGMRSPYGACSSVFHPDFISGGSSSGSGVSVGAGHASFSIGNDAAGSGRVPAAFNNIVGLKPTPGLVSNVCVTGGGCVKTIETVSVFALTGEDALTVLRAIAGYDATDPFSKRRADAVDLSWQAPPARFRFGTPSEPYLRFFGDREAERLYVSGIARLEALGGKRVEVDFRPFEETQRILYDGAWIAERALSLDSVVERHAAQMHPVTRQILSASSQYSAKDTFRAIHRVAELKCQTRPVWDAIDTLVVPTTPTIYRKAEIEAEPIALNARLGIYTNFVNLMGLCGAAVPAGFRADGLPLGMTFLGRAFTEARQMALGARFHRLQALQLGASPNPY